MTNEIEFDPPLREIVEWMDPDWRDHFFDVDSAADFYRTYDPQGWARTLQEMQS